MLHRSAQSAVVALTAGIVQAQGLSDLVRIDFTGTVTSTIDEFQILDGVRVGDAASGFVLFDPNEAFGNATSVTVNGLTFENAGIYARASDGRLRVNGPLPDLPGVAGVGNTIVLFGFRGGDVSTASPPSVDDFTLANLEFAGLTMRYAILGIPPVGAGGGFADFPGFGTFVDVDGDPLAESDFHVTFTGISVTAVAPERPDCAAVDFDGSGVIDAGDLIAAEHALNDALLAGEVPVSLDFNGDGALTNADAEIIIDRIALCDGVTVDPAEVNRPTCGADVAEPFGDVNVLDILQYMDMMQARDPNADVAEPFGSIDVADILEYFRMFGDDCSR